MKSNTRHRSEEHDCSTSPAQVHAIPFSSQTWWHISKHNGQCGQYIKCVAAWLAWKDELTQILSFICLAGCEALELLRVLSIQGKSIQTNFVIGLVYVCRNTKLVDLVSKEEFPEPSRMSTSRHLLVLLCACVSVSLCVYNVCVCLGVGACVFNRVRDQQIASASWSRGPEFDFGSCHCHIDTLGEVVYIITCCNTLCLDSCHSVDSVWSCCALHLVKMSAAHI